MGSTVGMMTGNQKLLNLGGKEFMKAVGRHPWEIKECPHSRASSLVEYVHSGATDSSHCYWTVHADWRVLAFTDSPQSPQNDLPT